MINFRVSDESKLEESLIKDVNSTPLPARGPPEATDNPMEFEYFQTSYNKI